MPIELSEIVDEKKTSARSSSLFTSALFTRSRISSDERRFFTEQLTLMLETGANLHQALTLLQEQNQQPAMARIVGGLLEDVAGGLAFSAALSKFPDAFSTTYVNLVAASEGGGFLHEVLAELLKMEEKAEELNSTVRSALAYPMFLSFFSLAVIVFVLVVVFPKFSVMFAKIHDQLPWTTIFLMQASDFLRGYWIQTIAGLTAMAILVLRWSRSPNGRGALDQLKLKIPVIKDVFMQIYLVQSLRVMSLSLENGVNIIETLRATRDVSKNSVMRQFFVDLDEQVQQGNGIAIGFRQAKLIPVLVQRMVATGEESGNLPKVMSRLSEYYERELTKRLEALSKMAEPIMLMVMGLVVGVIVSSLILPIFKLSRAVT
jgi:type II secretory pathway component PulF